MISKDKLKRGALAILLPASLTLFPIAAHAQFSAPVKKLRKQNIDQLEPLKQKISIAGLPEYSGKMKFLGGSLNKTPNSTNYHEMFSALEAPSQVVDWYKGVLSSYSWEITSSNETHLSAKNKTGATLCLAAQAVKSRTARSVISLTYNDCQTSH